MSRKTNIVMAGVVLEVEFSYTRAYRGSEVNPPEPASVALERVGVAGLPGSDLLDWLTPEALALLEEQIMEFMEDPD